MINKQFSCNKNPLPGTTLGIIIFLVTCICSYGQTYKGYIFDRESKLPIANANVFYEGMYRGTASNAEGYFEITASIPGGIPLIVNALGYYSAAVSRIDNSLIQVYLEPKVFNIDEVVVTANEIKGLSRIFGWSKEKKERVFTREFLGSSPNSAKCHIVNMEDITLIYDNEEKTLSAYCDEPIIIINDALGYEIHYFLDHFVNNMKTISYKGMYYFIENEIDDEKILKKVKNRREMTYLGSRMHFIRALWHGSLKEQRYKYNLSDLHPLRAESVITESGEDRYIKLKQGSKNHEMHITYIPTESISSINCIYDSAYIQSDGYFDPDGILWSGAFARQRVADLLPFDYEPENTKDN